MSKGKKIFLGVLAIWPVFYLFVGVPFLLTQLATAFGDGVATIPDSTFAYFIVIHIVTVVLIFAQIIYYIVKAANNDAIEHNKKIAWYIGIFMGNIFAIPIYWYLHIWKEDPQQTPQSPAPTTKA
ncbi:hypothetical protein KC614_04215 [candidate division WWE3 bacterium]|uniref:Uncharacterized protein n=1 Tax=candidate division WWE3 bacterium TaxID=2053526 RepID=A0A955LKW6_UNCKA|nr:hypothetical protein [candidate division WWE3 bacterium]